MSHTLEYARAVALLRGLVEIPSLSREEHHAAAWLVEQMRDLGFARAYVDGAGNAVGEIGAADALVTLILLGHIDTVPGQIEVREVESQSGPLLYGRGAVDAKGPLASFVCAAGMAGDGWARDAGVRVVVVGAVEEEAATSKGARFIRDRFNGVEEPIPTACMIGEPSGWSRATVGYKGRLLVELEAAQPMAHSAGPDAGVAVTAVALWNAIDAIATRYNVGRDKAFDQLQPSLRRLHTSTDDAMIDRVEAQIGLRLPTDFDVAALTNELAAWAGDQSGAQAAGPVVSPQPERPALLDWEGERLRIRLHLHAHEAAWRSDRSGSIVRALIASIRKEAPAVRPSFVLKTGTSDMNVVGPAWQCPIVAYGAGDSALDHTPIEHVALEEYWKATRIVATCIRDFTSFL